MERSGAGDGGFLMLEKELKNPMERSWVSIYITD
jgi:hypothetical protein